MIPQYEIKEKAREQGVPVSTIERDYVQNWILKYLSRISVLVLKGGTGIRKIYFSDYRFSDDLDFTLLEDKGIDELTKEVEESINLCRDESGISFAEDLNVIENENGFKIDIYFQITQRGRSRTKIKVDITKPDNERILLPIKVKNVIHLYSDDLITEIKSYSLKEVIAEKIRSIFQRTRPRDLYDLWYLWDRVDKLKAFDILPEKFKIKNIEPDIMDFERRKGDFFNAWENSLRHQLKELPDFNVVFDSILSMVKSSNLFRSFQLDDVRGIGACRLTSRGIRTIL